MACRVAAAVGNGAWTGNGGLLAVCCLSCAALSTHGEILSRIHGMMDAGIQSTTSGIPSNVCGSWPPVNRVGSTSFGMNSLRCANKMFMTQVRFLPSCKVSGIWRDTPLPARTPSSASSRSVGGRGAHKATPLSWTIPMPPTSLSVCPACQTPMRWWLLHWRVARSGWPGRTGPSGRQR